MIDLTKIQLQLLVESIDLSLSHLINRDREKAVTLTMAEDILIETRKTLVKEFLSK